MEKTAQVIDSVGNQILTITVEMAFISPRYSAMSEDQQQDIVDRLRDAVADSINHAVHEIAARSYESIPVEIVKAQLKGKLQFQINAVSMPKSNTWVDEVGKEAMLVFCDPEGFTLGLDSFKVPAKQRDAFDGE
jgi:hypothetical protein